MKCRVVGRQLSAVLDGELDAAEASIVKTHIAGCPACRAQYETLRSVAELARVDGTREVPSDVSAQIAALAREAGRIGDEPAEPEWAVRLRLYLQPAWDSFYGATAAAAAVLLVVVLSTAALLNVLRGGTALPGGAGGAVATKAAAPETLGASSRGVAPGSQIEGGYSAQQPTSVSDGQPAPAKRAVVKPLPLRPQVAFSSRDYDQAQLAVRLESLSRPRQFARRYTAGDASRLYLQVLHDTVVQAEMLGLGGGWLVRNLDSVTQRTGGLSLVSYAELGRVQGRQAWIIVVNRLPEGNVTGPGSDRLSSRWVYVFDRMGRLMLELSL